MLDVTSLRNVEELVIGDARFDAEVGYGATEELETWIISRYSQGTPFQCITFKRCTEVMKPLFNRLSDM
jgi:hypothetical protein